jgi:hypothetical protein
VSNTGKFGLTLPNRCFAEANLAFHIACVAGGYCIYFEGDAGSNCKQQQQHQQRDTATATAAAAAATMRLQLQCRRKRADRPRHVGRRSSSAVRKSFSTSAGRRPAVWQRCGMTRPSRNCRGLVLICTSFSKTRPTGSEAALQDR